jgi:hypothetical protein
LLEDPQTLIKARVRGNEVCLLISAFAHGVQMFILGGTGVERREEVGSLTPSQWSVISRGVDNTHNPLLSKSSSRSSILADRRFMFRRGMSDPSFSKPSNLRKAPFVPGVRGSVAWIS